MLPSHVEIIEVGPREGFQFEGIGRPDKIAVADKVRLVNELANTGVQRVQVTSFVSPKQVPQMADAEAVVAGIEPHPNVQYTGIYLNDVGLRRAMATGKLHIFGVVTLSASETFSQRNQRRTLAEDFEMQRKVAGLFRENGFPVETGGVTAAFGCNYEGDIPLARVLEMVHRLHDLASEVGSTLRRVGLADTMGWANPEQIRRTVDAIGERWPDLKLRLHLHDTRGLGIANVYAGLVSGVDSFDTAVGGLGGCPFAGHKGAAGNVCTEEVLFLCREIGVQTGVDLERMIECSRLAQSIVQHPLPSALLESNVARPIVHSVE